MRDWLTGIHLICSSKKGISSHQLHRTLGITLKTAWFMAHRIREAMAPATMEPMGGAGKIVEADEMELGRSPKSRKRPRSENKKVMSLVERGGEIRSFPIASKKFGDLLPVLYENVHPASTLHTDGASYYKFPPVAKHESVDHSKGEYARDGVHINTLEGFFSVFKRGMVGTYQHCGEQHLQRYLAEFDFRQNNRTALGVNDTMRAERALEGVTGKRLTYRTTGGSAQS